jgi:hypothetical protein
MHFLLEAFEAFGDLLVELFGEALSRLLVSFGRSVRDVFARGSAARGKL